MTQLKIILGLLMRCCGLLYVPASLRHNIGLYHLLTSEGKCSDFKTDLKVFLTVFCKV